ncbi:MAG: hypothetical protein R6V03_08720 [Kiritimatiellia bacterium]
MNLRVDLILEAEQRSGSVVSLKSLTRIAAFAVPLLLIVIGGCVAMDIYGSGARARLLLQQKKEAEPKQKAAIALRGKMHENQNALRELKGWEKSRIDWSCRMRALQMLVPPSIQFKSLRVSHSLRIHENKVPARLYKLEISGMARGPTAESGVKTLHSRLGSAEPFSEEVEERSLHGRRDTSAGAGPEDRVFEITCQYKPMLFE